MKYNFLFLTSCSCSFSSSFVLFDTLMSRLVQVEVVLLGWAPTDAVVEIGCVQLVSWRLLV